MYKISKRSNTYFLSFMFSSVLTFRLISAEHFLTNDTFVN